QSQSNEHPVEKVVIQGEAGEPRARVSTGRSPRYPLGPGKTRRDHNAAGSTVRDKTIRIGRNNRNSRNLVDRSDITPAETESSIAHGKSARNIRDNSNAPVGEQNNCPAEIST
ncbi:unnamed protein product, partial [Sphacelaria rigidula]